MENGVDAVQAASSLQLWGAAGFGFLIGWLVYYVNRYRSGEIQFNDLITLLGIVGGGSVMTLFPAESDLFGAYGVGLFAGFFGYFLILLIMVSISSNFAVDWFLDGRRKKPGDDEVIPEAMRKTTTAMGGGGSGKDDNPLG